MKNIFIILIPFVLLGVISCNNGPVPKKPDGTPQTTNSTVNDDGTHGAGSTNYDQNSGLDSLVLKPRDTAVRDSGMEPPKKTHKH